MRQGHQINISALPRPLLKINDTSELFVSKFTPKSFNQTSDFNFISQFVSIKQLIQQNTNIVQQLTTRTQQIEEFLEKNSSILKRNHLSLQQLKTEEKQKTQKKNLYQKLYK
ncbi:Hypothetical_protein [Hexamita inflata]|uniref:Hypothetical_protein n=1 Tax=Hexamita inflata TaxID=28002 RepID=A0AA86R3K0_9EUKA|nr:Hypothetical protein HINF_LOCUS53092 [Hexamita inflata]